MKINKTLLYQKCISNSFTYCFRNYINGRCITFKTLGYIFGIKRNFEKKTISETFICVNIFDKYTFIRNKWKDFRD